METTTVMATVVVMVVAMAGEITAGEIIRNRTYRKETSLNPTKTVVLCLNYPFMPGGTLFISPLRLHRWIVNL